MHEKGLKKFTVLDASAMAVALGMVADNNQQATGEKERCYGVAKAGKNDNVATGESTGSDSNENHSGVCLILPKGTCDKVAGTGLPSVS